MTFPFPSVAPVASLSLLFCALFAKSVNYSAIGGREKLCGGREAPQNSLARKRQERPPSVGPCELAFAILNPPLLLPVSSYTNRDTTA